MATAVNLGAWRDRTNLFISYRQSYTHHPAKRTRFANGAGVGGGDQHFDNESEQAGLMSNIENDGDAVIEMDVLPPRWLDVQDEISQHLADVTTAMKRLDQMHNKHVLPGFDDESVKAKEEREIAALTQDITRKFGACQKGIRRIDLLVQQQRQQSGGHLSSADEAMARNLKMSLASRVGDVSTLFRKKQSAYMKKLRSLGGMGTSTFPTDRSTTPIAHNPYTDPAMMDSESDRATAQSALLQTAQVRRRTGVQDAAIEQREREIESIAQGVIDLSNLFQEIQTMVIDQGSLLDRVDYNVQRTVEDVKAADKELKVATNYQKRNTRRKLIFLLILIVVGMLILLLVKPKRIGSTVEAPPPTEPIQPPNDAEAGNDQPPRLVRTLSSGEAAPVWREIEQGHVKWKLRPRRHDITPNLYSSSSL